MASGAGKRDSREILTDSPPAAADLRIAYGPEPLQFGDLRLPDGDEPHPLAIVIHGGSWKATFSLVHAGHMCVALRDRGIATWNVEYRRVGDPGGGWPATFDDVRAAVAYARRLPNVDPKRSVLVGHSAGGHLGLLAAAETKLPVVAIAACWDLEAWDNDAPAAFLGGAPPSEASPLERLPLAARQLFVHGTEDDTVPFSFSERFVAAARAAGDDAVLLRLEGDGHFEPIDPRSAAWPRIERAIAAMLGLDAGTLS
jgi:dipeptidyl aminopeptidase/acylaminoacyl peptidase